MVDVVALLIQQLVMVGPCQLDPLPKVSGMQNSTHRHPVVPLFHGVCAKDKTLGRPAIVCLMGNHKDVW
eukprot:CAMPEP_0175887708 /NCGR_PEP_ID=MMETSP0107_2-20121207/46323_1 /TAXON_ID=195067 ORGANISM="Goniomonas pacifica, Strain CCMP1869" /NCGR_SAMPLE_ID=MMETSP0107_2 /ASSEMBLY_ACC=CAM_ASM_000203 /LENGTH=68 /DNA_ID=CAMNT_0017208193 /DNA_START=223 /DNA_END=426 /DNA_ORIENTATION=+